MINGPTKKIKYATAVGREMSKVRRGSLHAGYKRLDKKEIIETTGMTRRNNKSPARSDRFSEK
ncbi:MAG: hypothetical protein AB1442_15740 [Nitrospirota bacterium]